MSTKDRTIRLPRGRKRDGAWMASFKTWLEQVADAAIARDKLGIQRLYAQQPDMVRVAKKLMAQVRAHMEELAMLRREQDQIKRRVAEGQTGSAARRSYWSLRYNIIHSSFERESLLALGRHVGCAQATVAKFIAANALGQAHAERGA